MKILMILSLMVSSSVFAYSDFSADTATLQNGNYHPIASRLCGYHVERDGNDAYLTAIDNRHTGRKCGEEGETILYVCTGRTCSADTNRNPAEYNTCTITALEDGNFVQRCGNNPTYKYFRD